VEQHTDFAEVVPRLDSLDQFLAAVGQFAHDLNPVNCGRRNVEHLPA
jgi:hypothetical protein